MVQTVPQICIAELQRHILYLKNNLNCSNEVRLLPGMEYISKTIKLK